MNDENIHKEQLLTEYAFIRFCNEGYLGDEGRLEITKKLLDAAKKDGLMMPLLRARQELVAADGRPVKGEMETYYSPHQLFLLVGLRRNVIKKGRLCSKETLAWARVPTRTVLWSSRFGFVVNADTGEPLGLSNDLDIPRIAAKFHDFMRLLHSLPQTNEAEKIDYHRERYFSAAPKVHFVLDAIKKDGKLLKQYGLVKEDLVLLRRFIGELAATMDPLEHWYYYIERHPQWRKDKLKGDALLAQELYLTESLVTDVLEIVAGPQPSLVELLHEGSPRSSLTPSIEYAQGCDTRALQAGIDNLRAWSSKRENKQFLPESFVERLAEVEKHLKAFIKRYGDRSYLHGVIRSVELEDIPLDDLDPTSQEQVKSRMSRYQNTRIGKDGKEHFRTSFWDELNAEGNLSWEERKALDYKWEQQSEVARAIEDRLTSIQRELWEIAGPISEGLISKESEAWRESQNPYGQLRDKETDQKLYELAKSWVPIKDGLSDVIKPFGLAYCKVCRQRPVQLHYADGDRQPSTQPICDECFKKVTSGALEMTEEDWKLAKQGEWLCDFCTPPRVLYKFVHQNVISLSTKNNVPIKVQLDYGRAVLEAKCPKCGRVQQKAVDWGWSN